MLSNQGFSHLLRPCPASGLLLAVETGRGRLLHTAGPCCVAFPEDGPSTSLGSGILRHRTPASRSASAAVLDSFPFSKPRLLPITSFVVAAWHVLAHLTPDSTGIWPGS